MQWTPELNELLNQSAFSCGYDFVAASETLRRQAARSGVDRFARLALCFGSLDIFSQLP